MDKYRWCVHTRLALEGFNHFHWYGLPSLSARNNTPLTRLPRAYLMTSVQSWFWNPNVDHTYNLPHRIEMLMTYRLFWLLQIGFPIKFYFILQDLVYREMRNHWRITFLREKQTLLILQSVRTAFSKPGTPAGKTCTMTSSSTRKLTLIVNTLHYLICIHLPPSGIHSVTAWQNLARWFTTQRCLDHKAESQTFHPVSCILEFTVCIWWVYTCFRTLDKKSSAPVSEWRGKKLNEQAFTSDLLRRILVWSSGCGIAGIAVKWESN